MQRHNAALVLSDRRHLYDYLTIQQQPISVAGKEWPAFLGTIISDVFMKWVHFESFQYIEIMFTHTQSDKNNKNGFEDKKIYLRT